MIDFLQNRDLRKSYEAHDAARAAQRIADDPEQPDDLRAQARLEADYLFRVAANYRQ